MGPGGEEHLGRTREILRTPAAPGATMDEDENRCRGACGAVDVEPLDLDRSVSDALGLADTPAHRFAVADPALDQLLAVRRVGRLVIRRVECGLFEEYWRAFFGHRTPLFVLVAAIGPDQRRG